MSVLYFGWLLVFPLLFFWQRKIFWEMQAKKEQEKRSILEKECADLKVIQEEYHNLKIVQSSLEAKAQEQEKAFEDKLSLIQDSKEKFKEMFQSLSYQAMEKWNEKSEQEFLKKEKALEKVFNPVQDALNKLDQGLHRIEKERKGEKEALFEKMQNMSSAENALRQETENLVRALSRPNIRGLWGELHLKRVIELAGMVAHCDFQEQQTDVQEAGVLRPDVCVHLPGEKNIVIDAKAPFEAFLQAHQITDTTKQKELFKKHTKHLRQHVQNLGKKNYWERVDSPEFVVLFLPAEVFLSVALEYDPTLIEFGAETGVILATPTTLIGLLRSVAYGWKQDTFSNHAKEISQIGTELYKRLQDMQNHWSLVGKSLQQSVDSYNKAMGSFERRVLVSARKLKEFGAARQNSQINNPKTIDVVTRTPQV